MMQDLMVVVAEDADINAVALAVESAGWTVHQILARIGILHVSGPSGLNILAVPGVESAEPNMERHVL